MRQLTPAEKATIRWILAVLAFAATSAGALFSATGCTGRMQLDRDATGIHLDWSADVHPTTQASR